MTCQSWLVLYLFLSWAIRQKMSRSNSRYGPQKYQGTTHSRLRDRNPIQGDPPTNRNYFLYTLSSNVSFFQDFYAKKMINSELSRHLHRRMKRLGCKDRGYAYLLFGMSKLTWTFQTCATHFSFLLYNGTCIFWQLQLKMDSQNNTMLFWFLRLSEVFHRQFGSLSYISI